MSTSSLGRAPLYTPTFLLFNLLHLVALTANALFLLFPMFLQQGGLPDWEIGAVMAGFWVAAVLARSLLGHPMDVWGRRPFVIGGLLLGCVAAQSYGWVGHSVPLLAAIRFVQGVGVASYFTAAFAWVADLAPPSRLGEALGFFGLSGLLTMATGSSCAEWVVGRFGFTGLFHASAAAFLVAAGLASLLRRSEHPAPAPETRTSVRASAAAFRAVATRPALFAPTLAIFVFGAGTTAVATFIAPFIKSTTGTAHDVTRFYLGYTASAAVVRLLAGTFIDRVGYQRLVPPTLLSLGGGVALLSLASQPASAHLWTALAGLLLGIGHGVLYPSLTALTVTRVSDTERAKALSVFTASADLGGMTGAVLFGVIASALGYPTMFLTAGLMVAVAVAKFRALERRVAS